MILVTNVPRRVGSAISIVVKEQPYTLEFNERGETKDLEPEIAEEILDNYGESIFPVGEVEMKNITDMTEEELHEYLISFDVGGLHQLAAGLDIPYSAYRAFKKNKME